MIAFDATSSGVKLATTFDPLTVSHTVTGLIPYLLVGIMQDNNAVSRIGATAVTYAGQTMSLIHSVDFGNSSTFSYIYALINPPTGANNIVVQPDGTGAIDVALIGISYSGVPQASQPDVTTNALSNGVSSVTATMTTTKPNDWGVVLVVTENVATTIAASTNLTQRINYAPGTARAGYMFFGDSNSTIPTGNYSQTYTLGASRLNSNDQIGIGGLSSFMPTLIII